MSVTALLARAKARAGMATPTVTKATPVAPGEDVKFPRGLRVELAIPAVDIVRGEVLSIDGPWIEWLADTGHRHWSRRTALRRIV